jgi:2-keto-3-deoxy-galactonokinase
VSGRTKYEVAGDAGGRPVDNSLRRHATAHWRSSSQPVIASHEPGENWAWCHACKVVLAPAATS